MLEKIKETTDFIKNKTNFVPEIGIILGSGLGGLSNEIETEYHLPYETIPNFPISTVEGHKGQLILEILEVKRLLQCMDVFIFMKVIRWRR